MADVGMPRLSDSMEEGTILRWLKGDGDEVRRGEEIAEIETDKATMTYEADQDGVLTLVAAEGDTLAIGEVIARIGEPGDGGDDEAEKADPDEAEEAPGGQAAEHRAEETEPASPPSASEPEAGSGEPEASRPEPEAPASAGNGGERVKASPVARRVARDLGVELGALSGSGPGGRIVKSDVEGAAERGESEPARAAQATARGEAGVQELSRTQSLIARRMAESKATIPDFALQTQVDMEAAVQARTQLKEVAADHVVPSLNDMVVKACALALREFPRANGSYRDGRFELHERINVGVAVATEDALVVPTVFDADRHSLGDIAATTRELAAKVRDGKVTPPELSGGTFTVSNLGMYGVSSFTAVINPPQAAILAVGSVEPRAVVHEGEVVARHTMAVTLVCDHRILYGAPAAEFLARVRDLLEQPAALAL